ncbi:expressed protein [Phakopsora pachyrhizi]|uniref:Expressed protein n=1 Tax=Phakopsora pachyrhizi TaxID=170000 RepID=A0AAV0BVE6_PHAPC|nr:expressed protein [Phakopsora pachyrhizi]CAH7690738.1 expressed protein [Phakopsora pachyrhizi]
MSPNGTPIGNTQLRVKDLNVKSEDDLPFIDSSTLGKCSDMKLEFGTSLQGRKADENAYEPTSTFHRTGSALKISIQIQYLCDQLRNKCFIKDTDPQFVGCKQVESFIGVQKNDGYWADLWNSRVEAYLCAF